MFIFTTRCPAIPLLLVTASVGCDSGPGVDPFQPAVPEWFGEVQLTIGLDPGPGDEFILPFVTGVDSAGDIYVHDSRLREVSRFSPSGEFKNTVTRQGNGPNEFQAAFSFRIEEASIWFVELLDGRVRWLAPDGTPTRTVYSGLTARDLGLAGVNVVQFTDADEALVMAVKEGSPSEGPMSPPLHWQLLRVSLAGEVLEELLEYDTPGRIVRLHGGRTSAGFPGPDASPIISYSARTGRVMRIERPIPEPGQSAAVTLLLSTAEGTLVRTRTIALGAVPLTSAVKDSLWNLLATNATLGGAAVLDRRTEETLKDVAEWPDYFPAIDEFVWGPAGSMWLRRAGLERAGQSIWLVLDSLFTPVAHALLPPTSAFFRFQRDQAWVTLETEEGEPYVARLRFPGMQNPFKGSSTGQADSGSADGGGGQR